MNLYPPTKSKSCSLVNSDGGASHGMMSTWQRHLVASKLPATSLHFIHSMARRFEAEQSRQDDLASNLMLSVIFHTRTLHSGYECAVDEKYGRIYV